MRVSIGTTHFVFLPRSALSSLCLRDRQFAEISCRATISTDFQVETGICKVKLLKSNKTRILQALNVSSSAAQVRQNAMSRSSDRTVRLKNLFKGYTFKFEFKDKQPYYANEYEKLVTYLGAEVREDAEYTISNTYYATKDKKLYSPCYILHSLRAENALDIELYRWTAESLPHCPNGSTRCHRATSLLKNDSLYRNYDKEVFCELCLKEFANDSDKIDEISTDNDSKVELIDKARIKIETESFKENTENTKKAIKSKARSFKMSSSDSEGSPRNKKFNSHGDGNKNEHLSSRPMIDLHAATKNYEQNLNSTKKIKAENGKNPVAATLKKSNDIKKIKYESNNDSDSSIDRLSSDDEVDHENVEEWWMPKKYSEQYLCKIRSCSLEPGPHLKHGNYMRNLSLQERRVLLKYLIQTRNITSAKGIKIFTNMHSAGYLTHRSVESLRNCFRRRILPHIDEYKLPSDITNEFKTLLCK